MRRVKKYPEEYKKESVRIYLEKDKGITKVSKELGIPTSTLNGWIVCTRFSRHKLTS